MKEKKWKNYCIPIQINFMMDYLKKILGIVVENEGVEKMEEEEVTWKDEEIGKRKIRALNEKLKKITPYIHSDSLNVTNTVISVHNYTTDSLYLNSIEKMYYKDINEFSKKPYFSINQEYPEDE